MNFGKSLHKVKKYWLSIIRMSHNIFRPYKQMNIPSRLMMEDNKSYLHSLFSHQLMLNEIRAKAQYKYK